MSGWKLSHLGRVLTEARRSPAAIERAEAAVYAPHLYVKRAAPGMWAWAVTRDGRHHASDLARTHGEALALGLAALETASVRSTR